VGYGIRLGEKIMLRPVLKTTYASSDYMEEYFSEEEIARFGDVKMKYLANKMADVYIENDFWISLETLGKLISVKN